ARLRAIDFERGRPGDFRDPAVAASGHHAQPTEHRRPVEILLLDTIEADPLIVRGEPRYGAEFGCRGETAAVERRRRTERGEERRCGDPGHRPRFGTVGRETLVVVYDRGCRCGGRDAGEQAAEERGDRGGFDRMATAHGGPPSNSP